MSIVGLYGNDNGLSKAADKVYVDIEGQSVLLWEPSEPESVALIPYMTSNTTPSGLAQAQKYNEAAYRPLQQPGTAQYYHWYNGSATAGDSWWEYVFPDAKTIKRIDVKWGTSDAASGSGVHEIPRTVDLLCSEDGVNYTTIGTYNVADNNQLLVSYDIYQKYTCRYWRLSLHGSYTSSTYQGFRYLQMYGY